MIRLGTLRARDALWVGVAVGSLALLAAAGLAVSVGAVAIAPADVARALFSPSVPLPPVLAEVRLPRVVCAAWVGSALACSGAILQAAARNPLADPGIMGVSAGAAVTALVAILFFPESPWMLPPFAFAGATVATAAVLALGLGAPSRSGPLRLVLSGVGVQAVCIAIAALLSFLYADRAPSFAAFMVGSLNGLGWNDVALVAVPGSLGLILAMGAGRVLDVLLLDDATAGGLGVTARTARPLAALLAALLAASAVSVAGLVGFLGLVVPNAVRTMVGPEHRALLPACALGGAALAVLADTAARMLAAPIELPVGALLALVGGPFFLVVLWRKLP